MSLGKSRYSGLPLPCSSLIPQFLQNPLSTGPQVGAVSGSFDQTWGALNVLLARRKRVWSGVWGGPLL